MRSLVIVICCAAAWLGAVTLPAGAAPENRDCLPSGVTPNGVPCSLPERECDPETARTPNNVPCVPSGCLQGNVTANGVPCVPQEPVRTPTPEPARAPAAPPAGGQPEVAAEPVRQAPAGRERSQAETAPQQPGAPDPATRPAKRKKKRAAQPDQPAAAAIEMAGAPVTLPESMFQTPPDVPAFLEAIHRRAAERFGVPWQILAAINELETDFGRNLAVSSAGAVGWMQFMPPTWRAYGRDASGDGRADPYDPEDAIFAAARYLQAAGAQENLPRAIFAYNHAGWYVEAVLLRARMIGDPDPALQRLLELRGERLEERVLADERITIYGCGREDIAAHRIDRRVLLTLRFLAESGLEPAVTSLKCGHSAMTKSGNVSEHHTGSAVDIVAIDGVPLSGGQGAGSVGDRTIRALLTMRGIMKPHQIISLMTFAGADNTFAMADHADHIHVGFRPLR